jgi:ubiquinone/menaquinone biosynthesis C-methylase UbiE
MTSDLSVLIAGTVTAVWRPQSGYRGEVLARLPDPLRRWLYAGGSRQDRLRDPDLVVAALDVGPGELVADLGPGAGHFTVRLARAVEPNGVLYAADADQSTLDDLERGAAERGLTTLRPVLVARDRLELPEPVDLLFVSATYHHLRDRVAYFTDAQRHLRRGGRVAILEARREGLLARSRGAHATKPSLIRDEMNRAGYRLASTHDVVRGYWFGVFVIGHDADRSRLGGGFR